MTGSTYGAVRKAAGPTIPDRGIDDKAEFAARVAAVYAYKRRRFPSATANGGYKLGLETRLGAIMRGEETCDHEHGATVVDDVSRCCGCGAEV